MVLRVVGALGILGGIDPVDDVAAPAIVGVSGDMEKVGPRKTCLILGTKGEYPGLFGLEVGVAELVSGIVVEVGEGRHTQAAIGVEVHRRFGGVLITDIGASAEIIAEHIVPVAIHAESCKEVVPQEGLLDEIVDIQSVLAFNQIQHADFGEREIGHVRHLSCGVDGVAEVGGMDVLVANLQSCRGHA